MVLNVKRVEDRIQRLEKLREFLAEPETAELLRDLIEGAVQARVEAATGGMTASEILPSNIVKRGSVIAAAYRAAATFPHTFTAFEIRDRMKALGFRFAAANPDIAVNTALRKLTERRAIRLVSRGSGRRPNQYERVGRQVEGRQTDQKQ